MHFNQIVSVDAINLTEEAISEIKKYSKEPARFYDTDPKDANEVINRIGAADCVLISWRTKLGKEIFETCKNIRYIGLFATSFANIDVDEARKRKIVVSNVVDYGDEAAAELHFCPTAIPCKRLGEISMEKSAMRTVQQNLGDSRIGRCW